MLLSSLDESPNVTSVGIGAEVQEPQSFPEILNSQ